MAAPGAPFDVLRLPFVTPAWFEKDRFMPSVAVLGFGPAPAPLFLLPVASRFWLRFSVWAWSEPGACSSFGLAVWNRLFDLGMF